MWSNDCDGVHNVYSDSETEAILTYDVHTSTIVWVIQPDDIEITFDCFADDIEDSKIVNDIYNASYVKISQASSTLAFVLNESLNGSSITCKNGGLPENIMTCYILVKSMSIKLFIYLSIELLLIECMHCLTNLIFCPYHCFNS